MELSEASEGDSPVSNVCSNGESMSSDSHLLTATTGPERRISFSYSHHQQMGFPPGEFDHSPATQQNSYQPDSCWSSRVWDQDHDHDHDHDHHPLPGRSMEAAAVAATAELPVASADSEPKSHFWDWDNLVLLPGKVDTGKRASEWAATAAEDEEVTGLLPREAFRIGLQSGSSKTPLPLPLPYYSSGIPGVAAIGKVGHSNLCSSEQKIQQKIIAVDNSHGKVEADRSTVGGFDTGHYSRAGEQRNFTLEQHDNESSWVFQNSVLMRGIEQDRRAMAEHYPNEILKRSDQQLVGEQNSGSRENSQKVFLGLGGSAVVANKAVIKTEEKDTCSNGGTGSGDDFIGLKLGKRTYFGDTAAVSVGKSAGMPMVAVGPVAYCSSSGKKRGTAATQIPRCQVEGCKMDLTTAKDYHRRHKVCAMHSKTAKVIVASIEQRFCQQCSRFHLLTEFDEGKRSCRKRLAGHNERRRKPQPDPLALAPGGASMLRGDFGRLPGIHFDDHRHLHGFEDPHYLWQQLQHTVPLGYHDVNERLNYLAGNYSRFENLGTHSSLDSQLQFPAGTDRFLQSSSKPAADRLLMLSQQHPKVLSSNLEDQRINPFQQASGLMGQGLSLSPSSGTRLLGLESSTQASHAFSGISESGCALSLLSSQPWGSMNLSSVSLGLSSKPHQVLERMFAENPTPLAQQFPHRALPGVRHDYVRTTTEPFFIQPGSQRGGTLTAGITPNAFRGNLQAPFSVVSDINDHPMLSIPHGHDSRALNDHSSRALNNHSSHQRPTIDLMELPSSHLHHSHVGPVQTVDREFLGFQSSRAFDSALYDTHAML